MTFHDLLSKLEAEIASLFAEFRAHPVVQAATAPAAPAAAVVAPAAPVAVTPPDFGPTTPVGTPIPVEHPAEPPAPAVPVAQPPGGNTTDPVAPGFIPPPAQPVAPAVPDVPGWSPSPVMKYADCTGQNIPLDPSLTYTITDCPAATRVETNITSKPCDPYILTVNGAGTRQEIQTDQCTVTVNTPTITVSVAPITSPGTVNLFLQVQPG